MAKKRFDYNIIYTLHKIYMLWNCKYQAFNIDTKYVQEKSVNICMLMGKKYCYGVFTEILDKRL